MADLIDSGLLPTDAVLEARVYGVSHFARVRNGSIEWEGALYDTPSGASIALRKTRSWNGWVDWHFKGTSLADLRNQLRARQSGQRARLHARRRGEGIG